MSVFPPPLGAQPDPGVSAGGPTSCFVPCSCIGHLFRETPCGVCSCGSCGRVCPHCHSPKTSQVTPPALFCLLPRPFIKLKENGRSNISRSSSSTSSFSSTAGESETLEEYDSVVGPLGWDPWLRGAAMSCSPSPGVVSTQEGHVLQSPSAPSH